MKIKTIFVSCCAMLALCNCDEFLTMPPLDQITEEDWWKEEEQVQMMVDDCYNLLYNGEIDIYRDAYTDNAIYSNNTSIGDGSFTSFTSGVKNEWKYDKIAQLNYVLEGIEKAKGVLSEDKYAHLSRGITK